MEKVSPTEFRSQDTWVRITICLSLHMISDNNYNNTYNNNNLNMLGCGMQYMEGWMWYTERGGKKVSNCSLVKC